MSDIVLYIMIGFSIIGGIDKIFNNKFRLGQKFEEGFTNMGGLALTMIGIISLSPIISQLLMPVLSPLSRITGADPSVFISSILATDMGGYATSLSIAETKELAQFNGLILASMMGATVSFTIPIAINLMNRRDFYFFAKGVLAGIATIPLGMLVGGLTMGLHIKLIILNLIPVIILSIIISIGLLKFPGGTIKTFTIIGKGIILISTIGLLLSILNFTLGIELIPDMLPFEEGLITVAKIGVILSGAYPLLYFISKVFKKTINKLGNKAGLNEFSCIGLITSLANSVPMMGIYDRMDDDGKIINAAFAVSGAFTFGGQLGYVSSVSKAMVMPFIVAKLSAGVFAILLARLLIKAENNQVAKLS